MTLRIKQDPKNKRTLIDIDNITKKHKKAIRNAGFDIGKESQDETKKAINNTDKTGKLYKYGNSVHRASAKGESPANMTGRLKRSVDYNVRGHHQIEFGYKELYGKFLEDGTKFMDKRPNIVNVGAKLSQKFVMLMSKHFKDSK